MERKIEKVLGYNVDLMSFKDAVNFICDKLNTNQGAHIVTINPEIIDLANNNNQYAEILKNADFVIPDGSGIKLALKLRGIKQEQIPGIDFSKEIVKYCSENNIPIALFGAKEEVINNTVKNLNKEFNNIKICYFRNGYYSETEEEQIINNISQNEPKLILVALGAPKQDYFINKCKKLIPNSIFIGVGGSFDVWSGNTERAPKIFRICGCEWLYRTITQPQRIKRIYKTLPMFLFKVIIEAIKK